MKTQALAIIACARCAASAANGDSFALLQRQRRDVWEFESFYEIADLARDEPTNAARVLRSDAASRSSRVEGVTVTHLTGLEGTGHHFYQSMFMSLCSAHPPNGCIFPVLVKRPWSAYGGWDDRNDGPRRNAQNLHNMAFVKPLVLVMGTGSFPMIAGDHFMRTHYSHPNEANLVEAARLAGIDDVRIMVTLRDPVSTLEADCVHRDFEPCDKQAESLIANAGFLSTQLRSIRREQYRCARYGDVPGMLEMLSWGLSKPQNLLNQTLARVWQARKSPDTVRTPQFLALAKSMEEAFQELDGLCAPQQ